MKDVLEELNVMPRKQRVSALLDLLEMQARRLENITITFDRCWVLEVAKSIIKTNDEIRFIKLKILKEVKDV